MKLSIIIVNFNGKSYLHDCLASIDQHVHVNHEVIVFDNSSSDGSVAHLADNFPSVTLIRNERNIGFAAGNNRAARQAKGEYILLLNNDTKLLASLDAAIAFLDAHSDVGVLGCKMLGKNYEYRFSSGYFPSPIRMIRFSSLYLKNEQFRRGFFPGEDGDAFCVDWVEGSFLLTRNALWKEVGGLDEGYFMYSEDIDYCKRMMDVGYKTVYLPEISYLHYGGYGQGRMGMLIKGFRRYSRKFFNQPNIFLINFILTTGLLVRCAIYGLLLITGNQQARTKVSSCWQALCESPW